MHGHKSDRILVVGTTTDYIEWIRKRRPGQAIFLTDRTIRQSAREPAPIDGEEILWDLSDHEGAKAAVDAHVAKWRINICGIACFDCEAMETTSRLAADLHLPYPSVEAIRISRDKYASKTIWQRNGIPCPRTRPIRSKAEIIEFLDDHPDGLVLKPICGSGSELVFLCRTPAECKASFDLIDTGLALRSDSGLFKNALSGGYRMLAEEWVGGPEYSCDFLIDAGQATILRTTRKIKMNRLPFGTISGYALCEPPDTGHLSMADLFIEATGLLGIRSGICMVDFVVRNGCPMLIELTPRPGGDCLPYLLEIAYGLDILGLTLDVAARKPLHLNAPITTTPMIGLRLHAHRGGTLKRINEKPLNGRRHVRQLHIIRQSGHEITMPPADYESWLLGHVIVAPDDRWDPDDLHAWLIDRFNVEIEPR